MGLSESICHWNGLGKALMPPLIYIHGEHYERTLTVCGMPLRFLLLCAVLHGQHDKHSQFSHGRLPSLWLSYRFDNINLLFPRLLRELGIVAERAYLGPGPAGYRTQKLRTYHRSQPHMHPCQASSCCRAALLMGHYNSLQTRLRVVSVYVNDNTTLDNLNIDVTLVPSLSFPPPQLLVGPTALSSVKPFSLRHQVGSAQPSFLFPVTHTQ